MVDNPFEHQLRLKQPCGNCPFRVEGAIELRPGRLQSIIDHLMENDTSTFQCHKTVNGKNGGDWLEVQYQPSGDEAMCAGSAAYLMKVERPTVAMRIAFATGVAKPTDWDQAKSDVVDRADRI